MARVTKSNDSSIHYRKDLLLDFGAERPSHAESRALLDWFGRRPAVLSLDLRGDGEDVEIPAEHRNDEAK